MEKEGDRNIKTPILGDAQDQISCGMEQPDLVGGIPAHCKGVGQKDL